MQRVATVGEPDMFCHWVSDDPGRSARRDDRRRRLPRPRTPKGLDPAAVLAVHEATRRLLDAVDPADVVEAATELVNELGGSVVPAALAGADVLPLDLSFGSTAPLLPAAPRASVARMHLETLLPAFLEDARRSVMELRGKSSLQNEATRDHLTALTQPADA
jgi:hypothetical protein